MTAERADAVPPRRLANGRLELALHALAETSSDAAPTLLLLHALGGSSRDWHAIAGAWPGAAYALDFAGHGDSSWIDGGGYTPESFAADADLALAALGADERAICIAGAGLGAYVALLVAGARPESVPAALLLEGAGGDGGGAEPDHARDPERVPTSRRPATSNGGGSDPLVEACASDLRPVDYAEEFARAARRLFVGARETPKPPWLATAERFGRVETVSADPADALRAVARAIRA